MFLEITLKNSDEKLVTNGCLMFDDKGNFMIRTLTGVTFKERVSELFVVRPVQKVEGVTDHIEYGPTTVQDLLHTVEEQLS